MYDLVFYFNGINRGGSEIALLRYLKNAKKLDNVLVVYDTDISDTNMIKEFEKVVEVKKLEDRLIIHTKTAVNCIISTRENGFFDKINANKRILWVQVNPKTYGNYKNFDKYDCFLGTSQYIKNLILEYDKLDNKKIYIANPIVNLDEIRELSKEKQIVIKDNCINIVTIARITADKGYDYVINIAKKLKKRNINFKWYMLGFVSKKEEEYYEKLVQEINEEKLENNIIFMGAQDNPYKYLKHAYISILLSKSEAWGLAVTEAKALAIPSIASNNSAIKEQIKDGVDGFLVDLPEKDEDYEIIVDKIQQLIEDKRLYNTMVENLKKYENNIEKIVKEMEECFYN